MAVLNAEVVAVVPVKKATPKVTKTIDIKVIEPLLPNPPLEEKVNA